MREIYKSVKIPYTPLIIASGMLIGHYRSYLGIIGTAATAFYRIKPRLCLMIFAPTLAFDSAYSTDWYTFRRSFMSIFLLAGPGVIIATFMHAFIL